MKNNYIKFFLIFFFTSSIVVSQTQQINSIHSMILTGDPILDDIRFLSLESGIPFLSFAPPLSPGEIKDFLDKINDSELSKPAMEVYYRILDRLSPQTRISFTSEKVSAFFNIDLLADIRVRFNEDVTWYSPQSKYDPFLSFTFQFFFIDSLQLYFEPSFSVRPFPLDDERHREYKTFDTNVPYLLRHLEVEYWPIRTYASIGGSWWNFFIGRDHLQWGTSHSGSLVYSDDEHFYDFAYLSFFTPNLKYSIIINHLPLRLDSRLFDDPPEGWDENDNWRSVHRYFYLHRIDLNFFNKLSFSLMEGVMVGNSPLELRYLNPFIPFHSMYPWRDYVKWEPYVDIGEGSMVGAFLSLEINWNIIKPLAVYGQFVMNQIEFPTEKKFGGYKPNSFGFLAGIHITQSFNTWDSLFFAEFVYTAPYAYILSSPYASFIQRDWSNYHLLGHSRDTVFLSAGAELFNNDKKLSFSAHFSWIASGELNKGMLTWNYEETEESFNKISPSGIAENKFILSLSANWQPYNWLSFGTNINGIYSVNNKHLSGDNKASGQISLSAGFHY